MTVTLVRAPVETEAALVARWRAGEFVGRRLRTATGDDLAVIFQGRPGGPAGPDFRDAVLARPNGTRLYGDVEVHVRARGWQAHGHARDTRYDAVVLHIVLRAEGAHATPLASGGWAPVVEVGALAPNCHEQAPAWPCAGLASRVAPPALLDLLRAAGDARFERHVATFDTLLAQADADLPTHGAARQRRAGWSAVDRVLCVALAEGLAYGRERASLRRAGEWLAQGGALDALTRELGRLPVLDATRLEGLLTLRARWEPSGPWAPLRAALDTPSVALATTALLGALTVAGGAVSAARAAIVAANVALPCAAAWATRHGDATLAARARALYATLPGLPSNQITRAMTRQLGMRRQPPGARAQQGLHHIWTEHCREKRCHGCPCAGPL
jgi:hypothetical protein